MRVKIDEDKNKNNPEMEEMLWRKKKDRSAYWNRL